LIGYGSLAECRDRNQGCKKNDNQGDAHRAKAVGLGVVVFFVA
jgi:hypothetical protein